MDKVVIICLFRSFLMMVGMNAHVHHIPVDMKSYICFPRILLSLMERQDFFQIKHSILYVFFEVYHV